MLLRRFLNTHLGRKNIISALNIVNRIALPVNDGRPWGLKNQSHNNRCLKCSKYIATASA